MNFFSTGLLKTELVNSNLQIIQDTLKLCNTGKCIQENRIRLTTLRRGWIFQSDFNFIAFPLQLQLKLIGSSGNFWVGLNKLYKDRTEWK